MPTVHREGGFEFRIRTDDHPPPHVHVYGGAGEAKVGIGDAIHRPFILVNMGMSLSELRSAVRLVGLHQEKLLASWRTYHG